MAPVAVSLDGSSLVARRGVLVLLDNARSVEQVRPLLPGSSGCLAVVTSRDQLFGLTVTEAAHPVVLAPLPVAEARQLLTNRLGDARVATEPTEVVEPAPLVPDQLQPEPNPGMWPRLRVSVQQSGYRHEAARSCVLSAA